MNFGSVLQTHSKKAIKTLTLRKSNLLLSITLTLIFFLFLSSLGNAENVEVRNRDTISIQQTDPPDQDEDGLSDALENMLGTNNNSKFGDLDNDGLYDFEEYLDYYGNNDTTDGRKYDYDNSTSVVDGVLDIYHYFGLSSNKTGYLRDQDFSTANGGFVDTLLWNVRFVGDFAAGGSSTGPVIYTNNTMTDVSFIGGWSGGTDQGQPVSYTNNTMTNVNFGGSTSGGSQGGKVTYYNNMMTDVSFTGAFSGSSFGDVNFTKNTISDIRITRGEAARSDPGASIYVDNLFVSDRHDTDNDGLSDGREVFEIGTSPQRPDTELDGLGDKWEVTYNSSLYVDPLVKANDTELESDEDSDGLTLLQEAQANTNSSSDDTDGDSLNDSYEVLNLTTNPTLVDTDGDGLNDSYEVVTLKTNATLVDTDGDGLNDKWEVTYNGSSGVNATEEANATELASDLDGDGLTLLQEAKANTNSSSNDTDSDGLGDGWEVRFSNASGVNATMEADGADLIFDEDSDGLNLTAEFKANTNPTLNDTDGDGLNDSYEVKIETDPTEADTDGDGLADEWEVRYSDASGVNATMEADGTELAFDEDGDGLNLTAEFKANTNPTLNDTDGDGLADGWEVRYNGTSGVNPLVAATPEELASDADKDGLSLLEEAKANTDPGTADNPMSMNTTDTTGSTDSAVSSSGISAESSFAFLIMIGLFTSFSLVLVVYRVRRRIL